MMGKVTCGVRGRNDRGAVAVMFALSIVLVFAAAAVAYDISSLVMRKHHLRNALDAAAHAAAIGLPDNPANVFATAKEVARQNDSNSNPEVDLFCVVASTGATRQVLAGQIPHVCNPGAGWESRAVCNERICSISCPARDGFRCNTVRVTDSEIVDYSFAPVIGITQGTTGAQVSVACHGSCGSVLPNAMDVVVVADRSLSMSAGDLSEMKSGINSMLKIMTPELQYVALGAIHRARTLNSCYPDDSEGANSGPWVVTPFSNDYLMNGSAGNRPLNTSSNLVEKLKCLRRPDPNGYTGGTHLAAAMNGAFAALQSGSVNSLPARPNRAQKVIIFETDGMPDEILPSRGVLAADPAGGMQYARALMNYKNYQAWQNGVPGPDFVSTPWSQQNAQMRATGGVEGCKRFVEVAKRAKDAGILVITIGYSGAAAGGCNISYLDKYGSFETDGPAVRGFLAQAASPGLDGKPSKADYDCTTSAGIAAENTDGDFFFCAATAEQLAPIFKSAIAQVSSGTRLIELPR